MPGDRLPTFGDVVRAELDADLVPLGFLSGQGGHGPGSEQVTYCTGYSEFVQRFPEVVPPYDYSGTPDGTCLDLVIDGSLAGVTGVRFEGATLDALLTEADEPDVAAASSQWPGDSVASDLKRIRTAMSALLHLSP